MSLSGPMLFWAVDHLWSVAYMAQFVPVSPGSHWQMTRCRLDVLILDAPVIQVKMKFSAVLQSLSTKNIYIYIFYVMCKAKNFHCAYYCVSSKVTFKSHNCAVLAYEMSTSYDKIRKWNSLHDIQHLLDFITLSLRAANVSSPWINNLNCWVLT